MSKQEEKAEALETLKKYVKKDSTLYVILRHVSRSGMSRSISVLAKDPKGNMIDLTFPASVFLDYSIDKKNGGVKIGGCGMDMGFALVNTLAVKILCPDKYDGDIAYSVKHHWL